MTRRVFVVAATALAVVTASPLQRVITVPEVAGSQYMPCEQGELNTFTAQITDEYIDCASRTTYDWDSGFLPTIAQRQELCGCKLLISKVQTVRVPHCGFYRISPTAYTTDFYSYKNLVEFAFGLCSSSSSTSTSTTTTTTTTTTTPTTTTYTPTYTYTPVATTYTYTPVATTAYTYTPSYNYDYDYDASTSSSSKKSKSKTGVIVGVIIGVLVVAAIAGFVIRKRKHRNDDAHSSDDGENEADVPVVVVVNEELSPLGGGAYAAMPPSPSAPTEPKDVA